MRTMSKERYINANELAEVIENLDIRVAGKPARWNDAKSSVLREIAEVPTANVVKVVRCGQCKHWKINLNNLYGGQCRYSECASIDHFCSYGKQKEVKK